MAEGSGVALGAVVGTTVAELVAVAVAGGNVGVSVNVGCDVAVGELLVAVCVGITTGVETGALAVGVGSTLSRLVWGRASSAPISSAMRPSVLPSIGRRVPSRSRSIIAR